MTTTTDVDQIDRLEQRVADLQDSTDRVERALAGLRAVVDQLETRYGTEGRP